MTENFRNPTSHPKQIILPNPNEGDSLVVPVKDVVRIEASGSHAIFFFRQNGEVLKTLHPLNISTLHKKMLQGNRAFIMIHESHIINRSHVTKYNAKNQSVKMDDEMILPIASGRMNDFLEQFKK